MDDAELIASVHAVWPASWVDARAFLSHVAAVAPLPEARAAIHGPDLYLAFACACGCPDALAVLEREHLSRMREFAAAVDGSPTFVTELAQRLRTKLLVAGPTEPAKIATYAGRGSLGGWIRIAAVRLARDLAQEERRSFGAGAPSDDELDPREVDPELAHWKRTYGAAVSTAMQEALAGLPAEARTLLKLHYVDGLSIDQVGVAFGKSRATGARMLAAARLELLADIRRRLVLTVGIAPAEAESLIAFVRSRLDVSLGQAFGRR